MLPAGLEPATHSKVALANLLGKIKKALVKNNLGGENLRRILSNQLKVQGYGKMGLGLWQCWHATSKLPLKYIIGNC